MTIDTSYSDQWERMRGVSRRLVLAYVIGPIGFVLNHVLIDPTNRLTAPIAVFSVAWMVFLVGTSIQYQVMPCPRCGRAWQGDWLSFDRIGPWRMFLRLKCPHCGLERPR